MNTCCICFEEKDDTFTLRCHDGKSNTIERHYCSECSQNYCFGTKGCPFCRGAHTHEKEIIEANFSTINSHPEVSEIIRMYGELWQNIKNTEISINEKAVWACEALGEILEENGYSNMDTNTIYNIEHLFEQIFSQS